MPTLFRFVLILAVFAGLGFAGVVMLVTFVTPQQREITETINPPRSPAGTPPGSPAGTTPGNPSRLNR